MVVKNEYDKDIQVKIFKYLLNSPTAPIDTLFFTIKPNETAKNIWFNDNPQSKISTGGFEIQVQPMNKKEHFGYYLTPSTNKIFLTYSITVRTDTILIE